jgi:hypothetical protein
MEDREMTEYGSVERWIDDAIFISVSAARHDRITDDQFYDAKEEIDRLAKAAGVTA